MNNFFLKSSIITFGLCLFVAWLSYTLEAETWLRGYLVGFTAGFVPMVFWHWDRNGDGKRD